MATARSNRRRPKAVTIHDVARRAGVSPSTVSKALNDAPYVTEVTRRRVLAAADALQYRPNSIARSLKMKRTGTIGLITDDLGDAFTMPMMRGIEIAASDAGFAVFLCNSGGEPDRERDHLDTLIDKQVDGVILMSGYRVRERGQPALPVHPLPLVYLYQYTHEVSAPCIIPDDYGGGALAARYLIDLGHTRIAMVNGPLHFEASRRRHEGFLAAMEAAGLEIPPHLVRGGDWSMTTGYHAVHELMASPDPPSAFFCASDVIGIGAVSAAYERQFRIPEDISIVGFDNRLLASQAQPRLTTVALPLFEMGQEAGRLAVAAARGESVPHGVRTVACRLVVRDTTASFEGAALRPVADSA
jgi:LacI family transcriptional regulator